MNNMKGINDYDLKVSAADITPGKHRQIIGGMSMEISATCIIRLTGK